MNLPVVVDRVLSVDASESDDLLILAASWEQRCFGLATKLQDYHCKHILMTIYDGPSEKRAENIKTLRQVLCPVGPLVEFEAKHSNPIENVRRTVEFIRNLRLNRTPRITLDVSTYTRKHTLQLLQGLDLSDLLGDCNIYHSEPKDFHTDDNEPIGEGVSSIKAIETFGGEVHPSKDSLLILFLGYEGRRAFSVFENLEPNRAVTVIAHPPYQESWVGRAEAQNRYLLSCIPESAMFKSHSLIPGSIEDLLDQIWSGLEFSKAKYNHFIGPLGTKAQFVGLYRYWRRNRGALTVVYASPVRYKEERADYPPGRTWLIDKTKNWPLIGAVTQ